MSFQPYKPFKPYKAPKPYKAFKTPKCQDTESVTVSIPSALAANVDATFGAVDSAFLAQYSSSWRMQINLKHNGVLYESRGDIVLGDLPQAFSIAGFATFDEVSAEVFIYDDSATCLDGDTAIGSTEYPF